MSTRASSFPPTASPAARVARLLHGSGATLLYHPAYGRVLERVPSAVAPLAATERLLQQSYKRKLTGSGMVESFGTWLGQRDASRPFHALVNLVDPHEPYDFGASWRECGWTARTAAFAPRYFMLSIAEIRRRIPWAQLRAGYDLAVQEADQKLSSLWGELSRQGEADRTLLIVASDHGQQFGEYGFAYHGAGFADAVTRVPLVVVPPGGGVAFPRPNDYVSLTAIRGWVEGAAGMVRGWRPPWDQPGDDSGQATTADVVYCDARPAWDMNPELRHRSPSERWNRRFTVAYGDAGKVAWDPTQGELLAWPPGENFDERPPDVVPDSEQDGVLLRFFPESMLKDGRYLRSAALAERSVDERISGWGY